MYFTDEPIRKCLYNECPSAILLRETFRELTFQSQKTVAQLKFIFI
jgi:hypothetical protein